MQLRPYQQNLFSQVLELWQQHQYLLLQLSTGGGKTPITASIIRHLWESEPTARILYLAHRDKLIEQGKKHVSCQLPDSESVGAVKAGLEVDFDRRVHVGSIQSLKNRVEALGAIDYVIVDEAHHCVATTYQALKDYWPVAKILGVTATPVEGLSGFFDKIICGPQTSWLIDNNFLAKYSYVAAKKSMVRTTKRVAGEYDLADLAIRNDSVELSGDLIESYQQHGRGGSCLVFCINLEYSKATANRYCAAGIPALHMDATTPPEVRSQAWRDFGSGALKVITNVALFDEGVDIPGLSCVQLARQSASLRWFLQACGRALRGDHGVIIDHGDNWLDHQIPCFDRQWGLDGVIKPIRQKSEVFKDEDGEIRVKAAKEAEERNIEVIDAQMVDIMADRGGTNAAWWDYKINTLVTTMELRGYKKAWLGYKLMELLPPLEIWEQVAKRLEYQSGWAFYRFREQQELIKSLE